MKAEFITMEQADRQYRHHGVHPDRPCLLPTLLDLHGDVIGADDVNNIAEEAQRMLANGWFHRWVGCCRIPVPDYLAPSPFFVVQLKTWRFFSAREVRSVPSVCFAVALLIPRRPPYLVAWTGNGPPPAVTSFPKDSQ